jgi:hypothetical protein
VDFKNWLDHFSCSIIELIRTHFEGF